MTTSNDKPIPMYMRQAIALGNLQLQALAIHLQQLREAAAQREERERR